MPRIHVNGADLYYQQKGSGPETIVFSHSFLASSDHFLPQMEALSDTYRCLAYDHRGHGQSEVTSNGYHMENLYADGVGFIEAMQCAPCHFVGLSTGGFIGLRLGIRRPELLRSLVLMDTSADPEPIGARIQFTLMAQVVRFLGWRLLIDKVMRIMFTDGFVDDPSRASEAQDWKRRFMSADREGLRRFAKGIFARQGVYEQIDQITTPTLVLVGQKDQATPPFRARRIADRIPGASLVVIPDASHLCTIEQPAAVTAALREFLAAVDQAAAARASMK